LANCGTFRFYRDWHYANNVARHISFCGRRWTVLMSATYRCSFTWLILSPIVTSGKPMSLSRPFRFPASRNVRAICAAAFLLLLTLAFLSFHHQPRIWAAEQTPLTFWAWRNQAPSEEEVRAVVQQSGARAIFLRAGQIDLQNGKPLRIRPVTGRLPRQVDLHLQLVGHR